MALLWHPHGRVVPEKCALSHGSGVLGRDARDSCRFWSPHVENVCTVMQIRLGEGGGGGGGYHWGGGGGVGEPRTGIIYTVWGFGFLKLAGRHVQACSVDSSGSGSHL